MTQPDWLEARPLPPQLTDMLLAGTAGRDHLRHCAALAASLGPDATRLQLGLLAAALEEDTLFGPTAAELVQTLGQLPDTCHLVDPAFLAMVTTIARRFSLPESTAYFERLQAADEKERQRRYLENECRGGRHPLFWLHVALRQAALSRDFAWAETCIGAAMPPADTALAPIAAKLAGDVALLDNRPDDALARYAAAEQAAPWPNGLFRAALAALAAGDTEQARTRLALTVRRLPEHVSAALALFDATTGQNTALAGLPGSLGIGLYTYNKAADIDRTLASLFASDIGDATVLALDNAATDATPDVLAAWKDRVGPNRLSSLRLPVNVGAPAARNWLAADPRLRSVDFVAYLDDDVDVPANWLQRLGAAVAAYPKAGVWGCHVVDAGNPAVAQGIDATLLPGLPGAPGALGQPRLSDAQATAFDCGAFAHLRPCLSVMGCCHLFRRERLTAAGGFDIRFSPSQYDDVDHDLRLVLSGHPPVYQGHLHVAHRRPAPVFLAQDPVQSACGQANYAKLTAKHHAHIDILAATLRGHLLADLRRKWESLSALATAGNKKTTTGRG